MLEKLPPLSSTDSPNANANGKNKYYQLPSPVQANVLSYLSLDQIVQTKNVSAHHRNMSPEYVADLLTVGDPLGRIALDSKGAKAKFSGEMYKKFFDLLSVVRDQSESRILLTNRNLHDREFFCDSLNVLKEPVQISAEKLKALLRKHIERWPYLPAEHRPAGREALLKAIGDHKDLLDTFHARESLFAPIHASDEQPATLMAMARNPLTSSERKVAIAGHLGLRSTDLTNLEELTDPRDGAMRTALRDNPNIGDYALCNMLESALTEEERELLAFHPNAGVLTKSAFLEKATHAQLLRMAKDEATDSPVLEELACRVQPSDETIRKAIQANTNVDIHGLIALYKSARTESERESLRLQTMS